MQETLSEVTTREGTRLHVRVYQEAAAGAETRDVLLLHGWPNSGRVWRALADNLLLAGRFRLVAPDLRGYGDSEKTESGYTCAGFVRDIEDVVAGMGLSRYAVVGHSMSGKYAQLLAARQPVGLTGIALIAPVPLIGAPVPEEKKAAQRAACGDPARTREILTGMAAMPLDAETLAILMEDALRAAPAAWNGWIDPMREEDFSADLPKIAAPTLVIGGERDPLRTEEQLRRDIVDKIAGAQYASVPRAGHMVHVEAPTELAALLVNFLDRLPPPAA